MHLTSIFADYHPFCPPSVPRSNTFSSRDKNFIIVDSHYFMNHKKILNVALRVGKGSMGMQGITELFHPWARKSFYPKSVISVMMISSFIFEQMSCNFECAMGFHCNRKVAGQMTKRKRVSA